ncbi:hypothetical protein K469DRAFT_686047 [Zopfia rhizophila CBS 207.26]|uniref:SPT2-domain-containing protein n=1 Tax=Zopfia rhizophila CBS 207.26 TaxID=1314779 RepID=A0A6A6E8G8_9PEZI|nr:hypothetical protein K469DRAFT_686047 [Zopfia rhizophila CBS 207.26]
MNFLNSIISEIDPSAVRSTPPVARQTQTPTVPKPAPRPQTGANGVSQAQPLKRKAEGQPDGEQAKIQRKDGSTPSDRANGSARPAPDAAKPKPSTPVNSIPYRGTASTGPATAKGPNSTVKKPGSAANTTNAQSKPVVSITKPASGVAPVPSAPHVQPKKGSYAAMIAKAKEAQQAKPVTPPVKHEPTKILTKKERLALRAEAKAGLKGKKPSLNGQLRVMDTKGADTSKEKRKPVDVGYQGTARPARKPVELSYKGTARPSTTSFEPAGKPGVYDRSRSTSLTAKAKPKADRGRYGGYASWSDEELEDEEEDYASDASSDMEGGLWDVDEEEEAALKAAKKEDAEALREENELKRQKEERRKKLEAMNKAAAAKKRY